MKFKTVHLIEQKILNFIKMKQYSEGIKMLQEYIASPKFIPEDGHIHGSCNVNDIKLRLDAIEHNVWSIGPIEFFLNEMEHDWIIRPSDHLTPDGNFLDGWMLEDAKGEAIGPFKSRYDAAVYGINLIQKGEVG